MASQRSESVDNIVSESSVDSNVQTQIQLPTNAWSSWDIKYVNLQKRKKKCLVSASVYVLEAAVMTVCVQMKVLSPKLSKDGYLRRRLKITVYASEDSADDVKLRLRGL